MGDRLNCYNSAGDFVPEFWVCNLENVPGTCCYTGDYCQPNGLCKSSSGDQYQGGCTDKSYDSSYCPAFCEDPSQTRITLCDIPLGSNATRADYDYCCDGAEKGRCCKNPDNHFHLGDDKGGSVASPNRSKARYKLTTISSATLAGATRPYEPPSESIGPSSAVLITEAIITSFAPNSFTPGVDTPSRTSHSEAGPSTTYTITSVMTEANPSQTASNVKGKTNVGGIVGICLGIVLFLLVVFWLGCHYGCCRLRSRRGRKRADKLRFPISKDIIGPPIAVEDESSLPESFRRNPNAVEVGIGLAIQLNSIHSLRSQPSSPQSPTYSPEGHLPISYPPRVKAGGKYRHIPSSPTSPSAVSPPNRYTAPPTLHRKSSSAGPPPYQYTDPATLLSRRSSITRTHSSRVSNHPLNTPITQDPLNHPLTQDPLNHPLTPAAKLGDSRSLSLRRSSTPPNGLHANPLRMNPPPRDRSDLSPLAPDNNDGSKARWLRVPRQPRGDA